MYQSFTDFVKDKKHLCVIQAENPDGDSLGSALALESILKDYEVTLYCPVDIPKYLRYFDGWSRVTNEFDFNADGYIIVDTAAEVLLSKLLDDPTIKNRLIRSPIFVLDHHETEDDLTFAHQGLIQSLPACCDLIYRVAKEQNLELDPKACEYLYYGILSDTLGLVSPAVTADTFETVADLVKHGLNVSDLDEKRREFSKKSPRILDFKADLIKRVEYYLDGTLAAVHIPWDDIQKYSDEYNPNVLILEELRMVEGVEIAVAIKTYPDGKVTGKLRSNKSYCDKIAEFFGGGGHPYAAGFRTYDLSYEDTIHELINAITKVKTEEEK
ncbi:DHH family phosphoesterase [Candidatus Saccharibacteria bacterium]|nr:DHH family phosphoesterase [Candidatus Saccharibacteria bacterium]MBQ6127398.1 DHH family phosphoesterase [Candidatus Saccharibacteria bacterium]